MRRKIYDDLLKWKASKERKAVLLLGTRQTGKTYIIRRFAEKEYASYAYFNLETDSDIRSIFNDGDLAGPSLWERLSYFFHNKFIKGNSVLVLDEIQACLPAYSALKSLVEYGYYDVIASGSLLGVRLPDLQDLSPMGYVDLFRMYPMDFEEFLWAAGLTNEQTDYVRNCILDKSPIDKSVLSRLDSLFRRYLVVGGMPEAVSVYYSTMDYQSVKKKLTQIELILEADAEKYSKSLHRLKINACLKSIPEQLATPSGKFKYVQIEKKHNQGSRYYAPALLWLERSGLVDYCYNVSEPVPPLKQRVKRDSFKAYLFDTGVLVNMMEPGVAAEIVLKDPFANNGAIVENCVACALRDRGYPLLYYERERSTLEIDFLFNENGHVTAMEVKSGRNRRSKSLKVLYTVEKRVATGIKLAEWNISTDQDGILHLPLFAPFFFRGPDSANIFEGDDYSDLGSLFGNAVSKQNGGERSLFI